MKGDTFKGSVRKLRSLLGAEAVRVTHAGGNEIAEHGHDWPNLTLHVIGACTERFDGGEVLLDRPAVVLHPAGSAHANRIADTGLETIGIIFDPAWLSDAPTISVLDRPRVWRGGAATLNARHLVSVWTSHDRDEGDLRSATTAFFRSLQDEPKPKAPAWLDTVADALGKGNLPDTRSLARKLGVHPAWLARAYRALAGEGLQETERRKRVESAYILLRSSDRSLSDIAFSCGFCDQAHMNRCFRSVLDRTPSEVRLDSGSSPQAAKTPQYK